MIPAEQIPANFNATSGPSQILNQPPVPVQSDWLATSGWAVIKNKPTIPDTQSPADWGATNGDTRILNKPTIQAGIYKLTNGSAKVTYGQSFSNPPSVIVTLNEPTDHADVYSFDVTEATSSFTVIAHCSGPSTSNTVLAATGETFSWIAIGM